MERDRADALGALYSWDTLGRTDIQTDDLSTRSAHIASSVVERQEAIDKAISAAATSWRIERMAVVDRNILRIGTFELLYTDLSMAVVINEAVELAKKFSTSGSGAFINGVLVGVSEQRSAPNDGADALPGEPPVPDQGAS